MQVDRSSLCKDKLKFNTIVSRNVERQKRNYNEFREANRIPSILTEVVPIKQINTQYVYLDSTEHC